MNIKLVSDTIDRNDINRLIEWLQQDPIPRLTKGEVTVQLEKKWANYIHTNYSVYVNSGSSAILLGLFTLIQMNKLSVGDNIIVPALSWLTDVSSPMQIGLNPILIDCNMSDLSLNLEELEKSFLQYKPKAVILVSVLGLVPDMEKIVNLCKQYDVLLIEDVCESMGSEFNSKKLGSFGIMSFFSMYYGHHLSTIEGGFINTNDKEIYDVLLSCRSHGWDRDIDSETQLLWRKKHNVDEFSALYQFYYPGFNLRSTDLQAFIGISQIDKLDIFKKIRNANYNIYKENIKNNELKLIERGFISNFAYPIVHKNRSEIVKSLKENNIEVRPLIAGNMSNKPFWKNFKNKIETKLENCEKIDKYGFYIPNHQDLTTDNIIKICDIINKF
jgi:CDP-6-deoxy-D-xylo-4-hexulose-3-dehydrase